MYTRSWNYLPHAMAITTGIMQNFSLEFAVIFILSLLFLERPSGPLSPVSTKYSELQLESDKSIAMCDPEN
jgi:hypothetical protein